jgi:hypothetical protein
MMIFQDRGTHNQSTFRGYSEVAACLIRGAFRTSAAEALNIELNLKSITIHMNLLVKERAMQLRTKTRICCPSNNATTPAGGREGWMDTHRGASQEDGRMPHGSPRYFGRALGESSSIRPGIMTGATKSDDRGQRQQ